jgi:hypothetical protein
MGTKAFLRTLRLLKQGDYAHDQGQTRDNTIARL